MSASTRRAISVVIPYYNGARFIGQALASVKAQTLAPCEVIVVNDGSTADARAALDREAGDCTVIHLDENRGQAVARNIGIRQARGTWVAFLDCDDAWYPEKLERQMKVVEAHSDCRAIHCGLRIRFADGHEVSTLKEDITLESFLAFPCPVFPSAVMIHRHSLLECGLFDPAFHCCEDLDLFLRFCARGGRFYSVPDPLVFRRIRPDGVSRDLPTFWDDADRIYRKFLDVFPAGQGRSVLREVHTDMALRAVYARDFGLLWRMLRRASGRDVPMSLVMTRVLSRVVRNRLQR